MPMHEEMLTLNMRGKMEGFCSISTASATNPYCQARIAKAIEEIQNFSEEARYIIGRYMLPAKWKAHLTATETVNRLADIGCNACVCVFCYANKQQEYQKATKEKFSKNGEFLSVERCADELPCPVANEINGMHPFRFEAFGDLHNADHAVNYLKMCLKDESIDNALWTKNAQFLWEAVLRMGGKPKNVQFILSSPYVNLPDRRTFDKYNKMCMEKFGYDLFDKLFTAWTANIAHRYAVEFNCCGTGGMKDRKCKNCVNCYKRSDYNKFVNELLR